MMPVRVAERAFSPSLPHLLREEGGGAREIRAIRIMQPRCEVFDRLSLRHATIISEDFYIIDGGIARNFSLERCPDGEGQEMIDAPGERTWRDRTRAEIPIARLSDRGVIRRK